MRTDWEFVHIFAPMGDGSLRNVWVRVTRGIGVNGAFLVRTLSLSWEPLMLEPMLGRRPEIHACARN